MFSLIKIITTIISCSLIATSLDARNGSPYRSARNKPLAQAAPYAIVNNESGSTMKNLVFRLAMNPVQDGNDKEDYWVPSGQNGTALLGQQANLNLRKLLETLNNNNFTSEIKFDDISPGLVNITISNLRDRDANSSGGLLLDELLAEANSKLRTVLNGSSIVQNNHRFMPKHPARSKPINIELTSVTAPPIRRTIDVVADNYTARKVADEANMFAIRLLHQLNIEKLGSHNLVQSPFAIYQGLGLLLAGAMGDTARELDRVLLGSQSVYENTKLTHDQDRARLLASFGDVVKQLQHSATNHFTNCIQPECPFETGRYEGGSELQHLIIANNLLFSPEAYEISVEFKNALNTYYNNTVLTKVEVGSTESIQVINGWIRKTTQGIIPAVLNKKSTFDEFNVMTLLSTSWLAQEWRDNFYKVTSPLRSGIRLKGQSKVAKMSNLIRENSLLEFVDDNKNSHFVDYIRSEVTRNIHHFHSVFNGILVDVVVVPFKNSNQRMVMLTPLNNQAMLNVTQLRIDGANESHAEAPDASNLSKMITTLSTNPRRAMRSLWNTIAPEIITKVTLQNMQAAAQQKNNSFDDRLVLTGIPPKVQLSIPLIRSEADASLSAALNHIGVVNTFDPAQANFIGINGHPFNYFELHLSNVISKTTFNLNEFGINYDRTVKTLESMRITSNRRQSQQSNELSIEQDRNSGELIDDIKLDRPFVYLICDVKTRLILYTGIVRNPAQVS